MTTLSSGVKGALTFILGLATTVLSYYVIPIIAEQITDTFTLVIFYIGVFSIIANILILSPYMMIVRDKGNINNVVKGFLMFCSGTFALMIANWILPYTLDAIIGVFTENQTINGVIDFGLIICYIMMAIVIPHMKILDNTDEAVEL